MKTLLIILALASPAYAYGPVQFGPYGPYVQVAPGWVTPVYPPGGAYVYPSPPLSAFQAQPGTLRGGMPMKPANVYNGPHSAAWLHRHGQ
jgi:hypothetical protein